MGPGGAAPEGSWVSERGQPAGGLTHVLLDLDGTLTDSEPGIVASLLHAFAREGLSAPSPAALRATIGPPFEVGLPAIGVPAERLWSLIAHYRARYEDVGLFENRVYDGVPEMLDALAAAGLVLALATAKPEVTAARIVEHFGLTDRFAVVAGATFEPGRRTKEEVIANVLDRLDIRGGSHVVMVGDRDHDVLGAHTHGLDAVGVTWGYGTPAELTTAGAAVLVDTPAELANVLVGRARAPRR